MNEMTQPRMLLGRNVVERASAMALDYYSAARLAVEDKGPGDVVTEADFAIERAAREAVVTAFPEDRFVGEEFGGDATDEGFSWLIDPIDGTVNFARRIGYFCVSLALLQDGRPIAAWIYDPASKELFWAGPDGCALLGEEPLRCATEANFASTIIGLGFSTRHDKALHATVTANIIAAGADYRRLGAGALCLAHVAAGRLDAYVEPHMNPWDAVGGLYIAACAGAVTLDYLAAGGLRNGAPVFAASPSIATQLLGLLPEPFSGTPLHRENDLRSAGEAAT
ncbi:inositol monophosphatase [Neorhizobium sp. P12A]|uniref:inositol monophosphatase family protein n=1 Tax=Neorhizobium sp. P12A TaxID=2268027 RepID=UPI0011EBBA69|nr:inositol monophosphatase [Neorhizobium sp. P12A]KAA0691991.1 inositol monophosphatase [Neorhizobium sp. P12A]